MYLIATLAVGLVCLLDLVLTVGVVRRLRDHAGHLERLLAAGQGGATPLLVPGTTVPAFDGVTVDGEAISFESFGDKALVGFFSPGCAPCESLVDEFAEHAMRFGGRDHVLAVLTAAPNQDTSKYLGQFAGIAHVVVEGPDGAVGTAFRTNSYPSVYLLDIVDGAGAVVASGTSMTNIPAAGPVAAAQ
jgi:thiol-disulfide isomerase/thioredoxin